MFKIHIYVPLLDCPSGGGNQFLKALRDALRAAGAYAESLEAANALLFNLSPFELRDLTLPLLQIKKVMPTLPVIARLDGPVHAYRLDDDARWIDSACHLFARHIADGMIFQSHWSRNLHCAMGYAPCSPEIVICNAPDASLFHLRPLTEPCEEKIKVIATSWSPNMNKGFDIYEWLDRNLDFSRFEFVFVGNSPVQFRNIRHLAPLNSQLLARELAKNHVYLTASKNDPCSNSLLEAMHMGLPVVARNSGGHPEIVLDDGALFDRADEVPALLERMAAKRLDCFVPERLKTIEQVAGQYLKFAEQVAGRIALPRPLSLFGGLQVYFAANGPYNCERIRRYFFRRAKRFLPGGERK